MERCAVKLATPFLERESRDACSKVYTINGNFAKMQCEEERWRERRFKMPPLSASGFFSNDVDNLRSH